MGPRAGLEGCGKSCPPPGFDPRTVLLVASRHTTRLSHSFCVLTVDTCSHPGHAYIQRHNEVIFTEEGKVNNQHATSHVGHNTKNEAAVLLTLRK